MSGICKDWVDRVGLVMACLSNAGAVRIGLVLSVVIRTVLIESGLSRVELGLTELLQVGKH